MCLVALLRKTTCNLRHPMGLRRPVLVVIPLNVLWDDNDEQNAASRVEPSIVALYRTKPNIHRALFQKRPTQTHSHQPICKQHATSRFKPSIVAIHCTEPNIHRALFQKRPTQTHSHQPICEQNATSRFKPRIVAIHRKEPNINRDPFQQKHLHHKPHHHQPICEQNAAGRVEPSIVAINHTQPNTNRTINRELQTSTPTPTYLQAKCRRPHRAKYLCHKSQSTVCVPLARAPMVSPVAVCCVVCCSVWQCVKSMFEWR